MSNRVHSSSFHRRFEAGNRRRDTLMRPKKPHASSLRRLGRARISSLELNHFAELLTSSHVSWALFGSKLRRITLIGLRLDFSKTMPSRARDTSTQSYGVTQVV
jgi:hypothetical protein